MQEHDSCCSCCAALIAYRNAVVKADQYHRDRFAQMDTWIKAHVGNGLYRVNTSGIEWTDDVDWQDLLDLVRPNWMELFEESA